jgi:heme oxygenase
MSLKDLTKDSHTAAEKTKFMKAVFKGSMPLNVWADWTYQKSLFYNAIESCADELGILDEIPDIKRTFLLLEDYREMLAEHVIPSYRRVTLDYYQYIMNLYPDRDRVIAHLYTWHMGDLHGGQMIKKILPGSHRNLEFKDSTNTIANIRKLLDDRLAKEANAAFHWAIRMMEDYEPWLAGE